MHAHYSSLVSLVQAQARARARAQADKQVVDKQEVLHMQVAGVLVGFDVGSLVDLHLDSLSLVVG